MIRTLSLLKLKKVERFWRAIELYFFSFFSKPKKHNESVQVKNSGPSKIYIKHFFLGQLEKRRRKKSWLIYFISGGVRLDFIYDDAIHTHFGIEDNIEIESNLSVSAILAKYDLLRKVF